MPYGRLPKGLRFRMRQLDYVLNSTQALWKPQRRLPEPVDIYNLGSVRWRLDGGRAYTLSADDDFHRYLSKTLNLPAKPPRRR